MSNWNDDVTRGLHYVRGLLDYMQKERAQLYGTIIHLMVQNGLDEIALPPIDVFKDYGEKLYILYDDKDGVVYAYLKKQDVDEDSSASINGTMELVSDDEAQRIIEGDLVDDGQ